MFNLTLHFFLTIAIMTTSISSGMTSGMDELNEVREAINAGNTEWMRAFKKVDPVLLSMLFTNDGGICGSEGRLIIGRDEIIRSMGDFMKWMGPADMTIKTTGVWLDSETAYETGEYEYRFTPEYEDTAQSISGKYVVVWQRTPGGQWKIYRDIGIADK